MPTGNFLSLSNLSMVSCPFITAKIGEYSFGLYARQKTSVEIKNKYYSAVKTTYPNFMKSLTITKVNGTLNTYELSMVYPITQNDDPNLIDKIFSSVSKSRKIIFTYGDCATPSFLYRNEEAIITNVTSQIDVANSKISYTVSAVSSALASLSGTFNFSKRTAKPSDIIKEILFNKPAYGLQNIFYGMHSKGDVDRLGLIPGDDKSVTIEAQTNITILDYLNYLVACMSSYNDSPYETYKTVRYILSCHDDTSGILNGPYFKIDKVYTTATTKSSINYYTIDIGYPNKDQIISFTIDDNQAYSLLYEYSGKLDRSDYVYRIDDYGEVNQIYSPSISNNKNLLQTTEADRTWLSQLVQFPIHATLKIRGLLRAAILMNYIRINIYFHGKIHNTSGLFMITKQVDEINENGYYTTFSLVRIGESADNN